MMKEKEEQDKKEMARMKHLNKELSRPLTEVITKKKDLLRQLKGSKKDQLSLKNALARLVVLEKQHKKLKKDHHGMESKYDAVEADRQQLAGNTHSLYKYTLNSIVNLYG